MNKRKKTPTVIQMEAVECGAAALGIVLGYYKRFVPLEELRVACGVSRDGSKILNIKKAALTYGLNLQAFQKSAEELREMPGPLIVFWDFNHFLVVEGFHGDKVYLNDPARGPYKVTYEEFKKHYSEIVMTSEKTPDFISGGESPSPWPGIIERIRHVKAPFLFLMITGFGFMLSMALIPNFTKVFFDVILGHKIYSWGFWFITLFSLVVLLACLFITTQSNILIRLNGKLSVQYSAHYLWHILRLPLSFYQQRFSGEIAYRLSLNDEIINDITGRLATVFLNIFFIFFYAALMLWFNVPIAFVGIIAVLINFFAMIYTQKARTDDYMYLQQSEGKFLGFVIGGLSYMETIKSVGAERSFFSRLSGYFSHVTNTEQGLGKKNSLLTALPIFLSQLTSAALFGVGGYLIINEDFTLGLFMSMQALLNQFMSPVSQLLDLGKVTQAVQTNIARIDDVLKNPVDPLFTIESNESSQKSLDGHFEMRNVTFGYSPLEPPLIKNFNLHVQPGQRVALVGPTGCGKTTIARLINGLFQPQSGEILFSGMPRHKLSREQITQTLSTVDQDIFLFSGTINENISLFNPLITDEEIVRAAKDACIHDDILKKPHSYQFTLLEGGSNLSGGQRQRIEIARGLILNPKILILDEATSALDSITEEKIMRNLRHRRCAIIMVAHRLSTIRNCDEIIVLEHGKVVQRGRHEQLIEEGGIYKEFVSKDIDV